MRTDEFLTDDVWKRQIEKYGRGFNKNLEKCPFHSKKKKIYSQNGEEGVIESIFDKIGYTNKWAIEFGAMDGKTISNTYYFREKHGFKRCLIEGDTKYVNKTDEKIKHALITSENINKLIKEVPDVYDFLSIDIDGDDYWVWKAMEKKARVVILEFHPGLPNDFPIVCLEGRGTVKSYEGSRWRTRQDDKKNKNLPLLNGYYGANLVAYYRLAVEKGYEFVTTISDNAIFVLKDEFKKLKIDHIDEKTLIDNYFSPIDYWGEKHRDLYNSEWVIPE